MILDPTISSLLNAVGIIFSRDSIPLGPSTILPGRAYLRLFNSCSVSSSTIDEAENSGLPNWPNDLGLTQFVRPASLAVYFSSVPV